MGGMYDEMEKHEKGYDNDHVFIDPKAMTLHEIFGFDNVKTMEEQALNGEHKKMGSLMAISTILAESSLITSLMLMAVLTAVTKRGDYAFVSAGDLLQYLNEQLNEEEMIELAAKMVKTQMLLKMKGKK